MLACNSCSGCHLLSSAVGTVLRGLLSAILLAWAVDGNFHSNFTTLDLLAVHLLNSFLLQVLGAKSNKAETTTLARFIASLKLLDHEARNWAKSDLGGARFVGSEEFLKL